MGWLRDTVEMVVRLKDMVFVSQIGPRSVSACSWTPLGMVLENFQDSLRTVPMMVSQAVVLRNYRIGLRMVSKRPCSGDRKMVLTFWSKLALVMLEV